MMDERFSELLPWYVNGTLNAEDRAWVERYLKEHPQARAELDWYRSLKAKIHDSVPEVPATIGLAKTMLLIRGDRPTLAEKISAFFGDFALRPAMALGMFAVIAAQSGVIFNMIQQADEDEMQIRALKAVRVDEGPMLKISFAPEAKEADIRFALVSVQGTLAGGPGQLGDYYVRVPAGKEQEFADRLKGNAIVQTVALVPGLPPRE
jgi:anti-sigma factor RsiW